MYPNLERREYPSKQRLIFRKSGVHPSSISDETKPQRHTIFGSLKCLLPKETREKGSAKARAKT
jgi:hypothetical protein